MAIHRRDAVTSSAEKTGERTRRVIVSDESVDRYNTTFRADGWETGNFEKNPVLLWCHDASKLPLGRATVVRTKTDLRADCEFFGPELNPDADRVLRMIDAGVLAVSHRFEPLEYSYNLDREQHGDGWYPPIDYTRQELLEVSIVTVPGNANALPLRDLQDPADLRLVAEAAMVRSADAPSKLDVTALRERALKLRAVEPKTEPAPEKPVDEQVLEVEGLDDAGVAKLVQDTVKEVVGEQGRAAALRHRGELEVA